MKFQYHVAIITQGNKLKFVTGVNNSTRIAEWFIGEPAKALNQTVAKDLVYGLRLNGFNAVIIKAYDGDEFINN